MSNAEQAIKVSGGWERELVTRDGYRFHVRPAMELDAPALDGFFANVTPADLRFRFLTGVAQVPRDAIAAMVRVDHRGTENFLAIAPDGMLVGSAMVAADDQMDRAEVAISIRADHKGRGIGWMLLDHVAAYAKAKGIRRLQSIESRENHAAIELEREMGFTARPIEDEPGLILVESILNP